MFSRFFYGDYERIILYTIKKAKELSYKNLRLLIEIIVCFSLMPILVMFFNTVADVLNAESLWVGIAAYVISAAIIVLYVVKIEKNDFLYWIEKTNFL